MNDDKEKSGTRKVEPLTPERFGMKWGRAAANPSDGQRMMDEIEKQAASLVAGPDQDRKFLALLTYCVADRHPAFAAEVLVLVNAAVERHKPKP